MFEDRQRPPSPFGTDELVEVPLAAAPLIRVIVQVRWTPPSRLQLQLVQIAQRLALKLADDYPFYEEQRSVQVTIGSAGSEAGAAGALGLGDTIHQMKSEDGHWQVTLSSVFLTVECFEYTSRSEICGRLETALRTLLVIAPIKYATRVGFRYVNRIDEPEDLDNLGALVFPETSGQGPVPSSALEGALSGQYVQQMLYSLPRHVESNNGGVTNLVVRQGRLPAGAGYDPTLPVSPRNNWFLDLDASVEGRLDLTPADLARRARAMSEVAYRFFRWSVKDAFLVRFASPKSDTATSPEAKELQS